MLAINDRTPCIRRQACNAQGGVWCFLLPLLLCLSVSHVAFAADADGPPAAVLLEKGIYTEETAGDLDAAMAIYRRIIDESAAARPAVAEAHYRLAMCLLKKGDTSAAAGRLARLLSEYGDQAAVATKARAELAKLAPADQPGGETFPEPVGARLKETLPLTLLPKKKVYSTMPPQKTVYEYGKLELTWTMPPKIAAKAKFLTFLVAPIDMPMDNSEKPEDYLWLAVNMPAKAEGSVMYGDEVGHTVTPARELKAGTYTLVIAAYETPQTEKDLQAMVGSAVGQITVLPLVYTQAQFYEIDSDGLLHFNSIQNQINDTHETISEDRFRNSDFVQVEKMYDGDGKELLFNVSHEGSHYSYLVAMNEPVQPGQAILMSTQGTMKGRVKQRDDKFTYYMRHFPGGRQTRRIEVYTLPAGAELLQTTPADMPRREVDGRIQLFVEKMIPPKGSITTAFKYRLDAQATAAGAPAAASAADRRAAEELASEGWGLWRQRKLREAEEKFQQAVAKDPANANAWNGLGWAQFNQGKPANARRAFEKAVALEPRHAAALNGLGWIAKNAGDVDQAIQHWTAAVEFVPTATASLSGLTEVYMQRGEYEQAVKYYRMWLNAEPDNADAQAGLKKAQAGSENVSAAEQAAQSWLQLVDAGKYDESWQQAAEAFRDKISQQAWKQAMEATRKPLGALKSRELISACYTTTLPGAPDGQYVVIQYKTSFENKAEAVETVTPMLEDGQWRVSGYFIK